jgi:DNA (cytosine-5)-methyltransferase 1
MFVPIAILNFNQIIMENNNSNILTEVQWFAIKFISLFAGCGGSSLGYHQAGLHEILAIEWDKHARRIFNLNFPETPVLDLDIFKLTGAELLKQMNLKRGELDLLDASPPCQSFSTSNTKRDLTDDRNDLYLKTIQLIKEVQPKVFVIENVQGMRQGKMIPAWNKFAREFQSLNYKVEVKIVKAEEYGVPQLRRRVIVIGIREDILEQINIGSFFPLPFSTPQEMGVTHFLPHIVGYSPGQFKDTFKLADEPMCTITKTSSAWLYEKDGFRRKPTIQELKVLSSFPEDFIFEGSYVQQFARIGNAVPPAITKAIGEHLMNHVFQGKSNINHAISGIAA